MECPAVEGAVEGAGEGTAREKGKAVVGKSDAGRRARPRTLRVRDAARAGIAPCRDGSAASAAMIPRHCRRAVTHCASLPIPRSA